MNYRGGAGVLLAVLLATSGCNKQATGQSVAVVNGEEVSQSELNDELSAANVPESADKKQVMPALLQRIVDRRLIAQKATADGLDRSPEYLSRQRRLNENLLIGLYTEKQADAIKPPTPAEIDTFMTQHPNMFQQRAILLLDQVVFNPPADLTLLQQLKDDHSLDAVAASLTKLGIPFTKSRSQLDLATVPTQVAQQIRTLPAGEPFVAPSQGRIVASVVVGQQAAVPNNETARRVATEAIKRQKLGETLDRQVKDLRTAAKIEYQPGFEPKPDAAAKAPAKAGS